MVIRDSDSSIYRLLVCVMTKAEVEMNCKLSLGLLMPEAQVKRICIEHENKYKSQGRYRIQKQKDELIDEVQKKFHVSRDLVVARLTAMKVITTFL